MKKALYLILVMMFLASPASAKDYTVKMITQRFTLNPYRFEPNNLTVKPGDTVTFVDAQNDKHDVMFMTVPKDAEFAMSPMLHKKGETWSYKFTKEGTYQYHCHPHKDWDMTGTIIVGKPSKPEDLKKMEHHHDEDGGEGDDMPEMKNMNHDHDSMNQTDHHDHADMYDMSGMEGMTMDHEDMDHMQGMKNMHSMSPMAINCFYGAYPMSREASGTAWLPESTPVGGIHGMYGDWTTMVHGYANFVFDHQGGSRGDNKAFSENMLMLMANRPLGAGTWGVRSMLSLDPLMGKEGYPLLLQTGETADGEEHLIDRQHPHDLFMELATTYSLPTGKNSSAFIYLGYPGEPALGPATFMHRFSGMDNPEAPISHHWLDSTHITFGVATAGYVWQGWKFEASAFNGREPDQFRWNFDPLRFNSYAARITYNPTPDWSLQVSGGKIESPEALEPDVDQDRTTASATYNRLLGQSDWQTTLAWGLNNNNPGNENHAVLLETALAWQDKHTVFGRAEWVQKDELFDETEPQAGDRFNVGKLSAGYVRDFSITEHVKFGVGGLGSVYALPDSLDDAYGRDPASAMIFARIKIK